MDTDERLNASIVAQATAKLAGLHKIGLVRLEELENILNMPFDQLPLSLSKDGVVARIIKWRLERGV